MFQQAKKLKMLGVIPGLGTEYAAPRKGGGSVTISLVECSGEVNVCKGQCQGPVLEARPKPVDLGAIAAGAAPHAAAAGGGLARKGSLTRGGTAAMAATIAALALGGAGGGRK